MKIQVFTGSEGVLRLDRIEPLSDGILNSIDRETGNVYLQAGSMHACELYLARIAALMAEGHHDVLDGTAAALMAARLGTLPIPTKVPGIEAPIFLRRRVPRRAEGWLCAYVRNHPQDAQTMAELKISTVGQLEAALPSLPCDMRRRICLWSWRDAVAATRSYRSTSPGEIARDIATLAKVLPPWGHGVAIAAQRRTRNALAVRGVRTLGDLGAVSPQALQDFAGIGAASLRAIFEALATFEAIEDERYTAWCKRGASLTAAPARLFVEATQAQGDIPACPVKDLPHVATFLLSLLPRLDAGPGMERRDEIFRSRLLGRESLKDLADRFGVTRERIRAIGEHAAEAIHRYLQAEVHDHGLAAIYRGFLGLGQALEAESPECAAIYLFRTMGELPGSMEALTPATARLIATAIDPDHVPLVVERFKGQAGVLVPCGAAPEARALDMATIRDDLTGLPAAFHLPLIERWVVDAGLPRWFSGVSNAIMRKNAQAA